MIKRALIFLITVIGVMAYGSRDPKTVISSDRMEMLRFHDHNEFVFLGNVQIRNVNFSGACERMWVYTTNASAHVKKWSNWLWVYGFKMVKKSVKWTSYLDKNIFDKQSSKKLDGVGHVKLIVGWGKVHLETEDPTTGEKKTAHAGKAVIYPDVTEMILTENPVVRSSTQGMFRGEKITFSRSSDRIIVENATQGQRAQVLLGDE